MIGLVTDSNAQMPPELVERYGIVVVPLTVTVDGVEFAEGIELDADAFYALFQDGTPKVTTSQPSPGRFLAAYRPEASEQNERCAVSLDGDRARVTVTQISGVLARRIVCRVRPGDTLSAGETIADFRDIWGRPIGQGQAILSMRRPQSLHFTSSMPSSSSA